MRDTLNDIANHINIVKKKKKNHHFMLLTGNKKKIKIRKGRRIKIQTQHSMTWYFICTITKLISNDNGDFQGEIFHDHPY